MSFHIGALFNNKLPFKDEFGRYEVFDAVVESDYHKGNKYHFVSPPRDGNFIIMKQLQFYQYPINGIIGFNFNTQNLISLDLRIINMMFPNSLYFCNSAQCYILDIKKLAKHEICIDKFAPIDLAFCRFMIISTHKFRLITESKIYWKSIASDKVVFYQINTVQLVNPWKPISEQLKFDCDFLYISCFVNSADDQRPNLTSFEIICDGTPIAYFNPVIAGNFEHLGKTDECKIANIINRAAMREINQHMPDDIIKYIFELANVRSYYGSGNSAAMKTNDLNNSIYKIQLPMIINFGNFKEVKFIVNGGIGKKLDVKIWANLCQTLEFCLGTAQII